MIRHCLAVAIAVALVAPAPGLADPGRTLPVDPVELIAGREVSGDSTLAVTHGRYTYLFATPNSRTVFEADPARYEIQLGGACARMGPLSGEGDPGIFAVQDRHIYIFASQQCRNTFLKRAADLLEADDPLPAWTPETVRRGRSLLDRAVGAMGGAAAIDGVRTAAWRVEQEVVSGEKTWQVVRSAWIEFPARFARQTRWDQDGWGEVTDGGAAFLFGGAQSRDMVPSQRRAFEKELRRDPFLILHHRDAPGALVTHAGAGESDGRPVELVAVAHDGATSTLAIDAQDGRILAVIYRGRGPNATFGTREDRYSDFRAVGALTLAFQRSVVFDGEPIARMSESLASLEIDVPIDPAVFARRGG